MPNVSTIFLIHPTGSHLFASSDIFKSSIGGKSFISNSPLVLILSLETVSDDIDIILFSSSESFRFILSSIELSSLSSSDLKKSNNTYNKF